MDGKKRTCEPVCLSLPASWRRSPWSALTSSFASRTPGPWIVPAAMILTLAVGVFSAFLSDNDGLVLLIPFSLIGLLVHRRARNKLSRLMKGFAKRAAKMDEVRLVAVQSRAGHYFANDASSVSHRATVPIPAKRSRRGKKTIRKTVVIYLHR